ncbi:hypothetical protein [Aquabacterium sp.]|uniref:hypothetical protein n=1 Tax=Aquabacterium sp. TaxID=1872578 RepID=UPI002BB76905|nr:hypothetical protein [Aquabacterium sp.]HSW04116.1 hypothetical protein [Aquabacterium sp.]
MPMNLSRTDAYADLGDAWLRYQSARLHQRHLQFGQHCRLDADALLGRAARNARAARSIQAPSQRARASADRFRRATMEAIERCAWLDFR